MLGVGTFGGLRLQIGGSAAMPLEARSAEALLVYLALQERTVPRDVLAHLLWPEHDRARARGNLRTAVHRLRRHFPEHVQADRKAIGIGGAIEVDALLLERRLRAGDVVAAADLYSGDFLAGFHFDESAEFEAWVETEGQRLRTLALGAHQGAVAGALAEGAAGEALDRARALLTLEPLHAPTHRVVMRLLHDDGRGPEALAHFGAYRRRLVAEVDLEPDAETARLADAIRLGTKFEGDESAPARPAPTPSDDWPVRRGLPHRRSLGVMFGREDELATLHDRLVGAAGAWVQLLGPGGIGKTTLAVAAGHAVAEGFDDVLFVSGVNVANGSELAAGLANAAGGPSPPGTDPIARAELALRDERILVVLDNVDDIVDLELVLPRLGAALPNASWLLTTRLRLDIPGSDVLTIGGLAADAAEGSTLPPAAALFLDRARRTGGIVDPARDAEAAAAAARAVEGHPLAIELAAGWVRLLGLDGAVHMLLEGTPLEAAPGAAHEPRHGSIDAVLSASWAILGPDQRLALARLAVFRDGCTLAAAGAVAGVDLRMVAQLRDASMLDVTAAGRLTQHPLVKRYVRHRVEQERIPLDDVRARHAQAYVELTLRENDARLAGAPRALDLLARDHANVVLAWRWAIEHDWWEPLHGLAPATFPAMLAHVGRIPAWWKLLADASARVPPESLAASMIEMHLALGDLFDGRTDLALSRLRVAADAVRRFDAPVPDAWIAYHVLGAAGPRDTGEAREALARTYGSLVPALHDGLRARVATKMMATAENLADSDRWYGVADGLLARVAHGRLLAKLQVVRAEEERSYRGDHVTAVRLSAAAVTLLRDAWQQFELPQALAQEAACRLAAGDLHIALERALEALELGRTFEAKSPYDPHFAMQAAAMIRWYLGDRPGARAILSRRTPTAYDPTFARSLIEAAFAREDGDLVAARRALDAAAPHVTRSPHRAWRYQALTFDLADAELALAEESTARARSLLHAILPAAIAIESLPLTLEALAVAATTVEGSLAVRVGAAVAGHSAAPYRVRRRPEIRAAGVATGGLHAADALDLASLVKDVLAHPPPGNGIADANPER